MRNRARRRLAWHYALPMPVRKPTPWARFVAAIRTLLRLSLVLAIVLGAAGCELFIPSCDEYGISQKRTCYSNGVCFSYEFYCADGTRGDTCDDHGGATCRF